MNDCPYSVVPDTVRGCYYSKQAPGKYFNDQRDDPTEELYRKLISQMKVKYPAIHWGHLESCGVNAMTNCLGVTLEGRRIIDRLTQTMGIYKQQFPHILIGYLNDPNNYKKMKELRDNLDPRLLQGNRVPQYYYLVALEVCGIRAHFEWGCSIEKVKEYLYLRHPVQVCEPGHYLAAVSYDLKDSDIIYVYNSYPKTGSGINEKRTRADFKNFADWLIWYEIS